MNLIKNIVSTKQGLFFLILLVVSFVFVGGSIIPSAKASAVSQSQSNVTKCSSTFLGLEPWYQYMGSEIDPTNCEVHCFNVLNLSKPNECHQSSSDIPLILLAVVDDLLRIAGILAIAFILYGAFEFIGSQGSSEVTARARSMVINALIGLVVAIISVAAISYIGNTIR